MTKRGGEIALSAGSRARAHALRLGSVRPLYVLAPLIVVQWVSVLVFALNVPHNGWLYYNGGDATEYWTHEWALAHGLLPQTALGYGVPIFFAWVPKLFGDTILAGLPAIVLVQVLVLGPIGLFALYGIASRLANRLFGAWCAFLWVVVPFAVLPLWRADYQGRWQDNFLPQALGLVNLGDYPSMVVILAASYFVFRVLDEGHTSDAVLAGLLIGLAVGIKPANALMIPVPFLALVLTRRLRLVASYGLSLLPALITLALWKQRGIGHLPLFSLPELRVATGPAIHALPASNYIRLDLSQFARNLRELREYFWSRAFCEVLVIGGMLAATRKSTAKGVYVAAWFIAYIVVKGSAAQASVTTTSFFRLTMPGLPAFLLLAACFPLLVPGWGRRGQSPDVLETPIRASRGLVLAVALLAALPFAVVAAASPAPAGKIASAFPSGNDAPISRSLSPRASPFADGVRLRWRPVRAHGARVFYMVFRVQNGDGCSTAGTASDVCIFKMPYLGRTAITTLIDTPIPGRYTYRVAAAASWQAQNADLGDLVLLSEPVSFDVRCTTETCRRAVARLRARR